MAGSMRITLNDGVVMPLFGIGLYTVLENINETVQAAVDNGYRLFDTAMYYDNEKGTGDAIRNSGLNREDYFVVTKLWVSDHGYEQTKAAFNASLKKLGLDYIDLYLIHSPSGGKIIETWKAITEIKKAGFARSIGVSNFNTHHLERLKQGCEEFDLPLPSINQIEMHPWLQQRKVVDCCKAMGIELMGFCPLARCVKFDKEPAVQDFAKRHAKSQAQIIIRWALQRKFVTIPKSSKIERIKENCDVADFSLSDEEMGTLDALDSELRVSTNAIEGPWVE